LEGALAATDVRRDAAESDRLRALLQIAAR